MACCEECNECEETTQNNCLEDCGCPIEITSLACIRHNGYDLPCIDVVKGETLEAILSKINNKFCEMLPGLNGEDGADGQGIDHVSFTGEPGTEGQPGQLNEYTLWGDVAETINLGTVNIYNGANGQGIDHVSFTSTDGTNPAAGSPGQTDTYTMWGDVMETINLGTFLVYNGNNGIDGYDSGWIPMNDFNGTYNFGLPAFTSGWAHPKIRVVGKTVFLEGYLMIPLSDDAQGGTTLVTNVNEYPDTYRADVQVYTGAAGGFDLINNGRMKHHNPMMPQDLAPSEPHIISTFEMSYRALNDVGNKYELNITSLFPTTKINTDGTLEISTLTQTDGEGTTGTIIQNSPFHQIVSRVTRGLSAPDYGEFYTEWDGASATDKRTSPASSGQYPDSFDGRLTKDLGGFKVKLSTCYPLGSNVTLTQIQQAIAQIQE